ncbi:MAG: signal peptidase II [Betaproteobacteria bacterium CG2_30_59_46]|nr:MAG: signal peptidase II [Betaproteobacteria bacterium CG2_30_59_46]PIQ13562.1 MAG: signal peptidase II [Hydrogenophilales bacterium CG18_big_fil_WC_8_21_14_2_50_58_12]PIX98519.1 MAG: signal peptidase II [Hydrogenophilales bacterium CG_4_10_14_3_um_filter_58_23]PJB04356.1 MAG: signal peptidase II [Hydrogenophilales bacterium CG_4_9_14_3_um_filter_59_35]
MRSGWGWLALSAVVIALDQLTKQWVSQSLAFGEAIPVMPSFNLVLAHNTGAAFSFLAGAGGWQRGFFSVIAVVAAGVIVHLLRKHHEEKIFSLALALILGGALGNLIDRILLGHVVDFLDFYVQGYHWPAFNVADMAITGGAGLLIWGSLKKP